MLRIWLLSLVGMSILGMIVIAVTEKTAQSSVVKFCVSLALMLTFLRPVLQIDDIVLPIFAKAHDSEKYIQSANSLKTQLISQRLSEYLETYAYEIHNVACCAEVVCKTDESGVVICDQIRITCQTDSENFRNDMGKKILAEFGIAEHNLQFVKG